MWVIRYKQADPKQYRLFPIRNECYLTGYNLELSMFDISPVISNSLTFETYEEATHLLSRMLLFPDPSWSVIKLEQAQ